MLLSWKFASRMSFAAAAVACAIVLSAHEARADDSETPASVASNETEPASPPPPVPPQTAPAPTPASASGGAPATKQPPAGAGGPEGDTGTQEADVETDGTAVAGSGNNDAAAVGTVAPAPAPAPEGNDAAAGAEVTTGGATATGSDAGAEVVQQADGVAEDDGVVDIIQIALVINVGAAGAESGDNSATTGAASGSGSGASAADASIATGSAGAVGVAADTTVTQAATVGSGESSTQIAAVLNIGIGIGNTGLNISFADIIVDGRALRDLAVDGGSLTAIRTGPATAIGNAAASHIRQSATGYANENAVLVVDQRAAIVNFGLALANSGGNTASSGVRISAAELERLQPLFTFLSGLLESFTTSRAAAGGRAEILTGTAQALGNVSSTSVVQHAAGRASGSDHTRIDQQATVSNLGVALANSGWNTAIAGAAGGADALGTGAALERQDMEELTAWFETFLDVEWLDLDDPFGAFVDEIALDGVSIALDGDATGRDVVITWDDDGNGGEAARGVRIRQILATLDIGYAFSDAGGNTAVVTADRRDVSGADLAASSGALVMDAAAARVVTGDVLAIGNGALVVVCQAFRDAACTTPTVDPSAPATGTATATAAAAAADPTIVAAVMIDQQPATDLGRSTDADPGGADAASLPFTGSDARTLAGTGVLLLLVGGGLVRRRRPAEQ